MEPLALLKSEFSLFPNNPKYPQTLWAPLPESWTVGGSDGLAKATKRVSGKAENRTPECCPVILAAVSPRST